MSKLLTKARAGVTLVELLVVILIVTILSVSLLPLFKPYIEQAKYAAEVQPTLGNIQTKINLYQYEKDKLPCTKYSDNAGVKTEDGSTYDDTDYTWMVDTDKSSERLRAYKIATRKGAAAANDATSADYHLANDIDVDWQDLIGKRMNPSQFRYHLIKGLGAAKYGYAIGVFGDGDGLARGTGYAILVLVDTKNGAKVIATWERYKPQSDEAVIFTAQDSGQQSANACIIPTFSKLDGTLSESNWGTILKMLKGYGWSFNFDDYTETSSTSNP